MEFLTPKFRSDELTCLNAPTGQLPYTAPADVVSERIRGIDEAGEDCRQKLDRVRMKVDVFEEVVEDINSRKKKD